MHPLVQEFDNTAFQYAQVDYLPRTIGQRLIDRVEELHDFQPKHILDLGCGTGLSLQLLKKRYPDSQLTGIDWSNVALAQAKQTVAMYTQISLIQGDMEVLPIAPNAFDFIYANLSFLWIHDLKAHLQKLKRCLKPGGLLLFTLLGLDTFESLRNASNLYPFGFSDIHTIGDTLVAARYKDVVMDVDHFVTKHDNAASGYEEIKQLGLHTLFGTPNNLPNKQQTPVTDYQINWEIIYAQAWNFERFEDMTQAGEVSIPISELATY